MSRGDGKETRPASLLKHYPFPLQPIAHGDGIPRMAAKVSIGPKVEHSIDGMGSDDILSPKSINQQESKKADFKAL